MTKAEIMKTVMDSEPMKHINMFENDGSIIQSSSAFLYLAITEYKTPGREGVKERILKHIRSFITGGNEPMFTAGPFWHYETVSMGFAVIRFTPSVWDELSLQERDRVDLIMKCYAIASAFVNNDCNSFKTGPSLTGNHSKTWNPNHRMAMVFPIVAATVYFSAGGDGVEAVNAILTEFDHDYYISKFDEYGFTRAKHSWTAKGVMLDDGTKAPDAKELMMTGGDAYLSVEDRGSINNKFPLKLPLGSGLGVRHRYSYHGIGLDDIPAIVTDLYEHNYSGGKIISDTKDMSGGTDEEGKPLAYILDGTRSPYEGLDGMMREFVSGDAGGIRSSTSYCFHDFVLVAQSFAALDALGVYSIDKKSELWSKIANGNADVIYKGEHGYRSYSIGKGYETYDDKNLVYLVWKSWWLENVR